MSEPKTMLLNEMLVARRASCRVDQTEANLVEIWPQNHQNVQKPHFWQNAQGVNGLSFHASVPLLTMNFVITVSK